MKKVIKWIDVKFVNSLKKMNFLKILIGANTMKNIYLIKMKFVKIFNE